MGGLTAALRLALLALLLSGTGIVACASRSSDGFHYTVQGGDNLYRIGKRFGVPAQTLVAQNAIGDVHNLQIGTRLWIPTAGAKRGGRPLAKPARIPREKIRTQTDLDLAWPVRGARLTSGFGRRGRSMHEGIDLVIDKGTPIYAAESGKVIHSGKLGDYGKVVIVKHAGHYRTVYAHARKLRVRKGDFVEKGQRIADVGKTGNATTAHLHFEVRSGHAPRDPLRYLP